MRVPNLESGSRLERTCSQRFSSEPAYLLHEDMKKISWFLLVMTGLACASILYFVTYTLFRIPFL
jgi:hypothetical protein